ncbi:NAD-dependent epimerase/dehydratase family protein [Shewanella frigidimarina]|uniref:NAD-dependent epimerase/dehydratase family protein n=1 Tax=Shewanella frigidimarina TaxID=56812 RepID=UPI003D7A5F16
MKTKVLVTGSEGFLGKAVCRELSAFGYQIVPFDINSNYDIMNREQILDALNNSHTCT